MHRHGRDEILGSAYSDRDLVVFLENVGIADPDAVLDDLRWVEWRGGRAHKSALPDEGTVSGRVSA